MVTIKYKRFDLSYHYNFFKATITIEWNGCGQPLCSVVFRWFLGPPTIVFDGFQRLSTIGQMMRCDVLSFQSTTNQVCSLSINRADFIQLEVYNAWLLHFCGSSYYKRMMSLKSTLASNPWSANRLENLKALISGNHYWACLPITGDPPR